MAQNQNQMQLLIDAVSFDPVAFDTFINNHGVKMVHFRALRCPVGLIDPDDIRRPHDHHEACSNGFIYVRAGVVTVGFINNNSDVRFQDSGRIDSSSVMAVIPRFYDDDEGRAVDAQTFDRFYLLDTAVTVSASQTFAAHITGVDRLNFPAVTVSDLIDADGIRYYQDKDFAVKGGQIHWSANRPGQDTKLLRGKVCSIRYNFSPFWYVKNLVHEVRLAQVQDEFTMERVVARMPMAVILQREFFFEREQRDAMAKDVEGRQKPEPGDGIFGPR